jgi:tetratricopeptide (TPR) repeat protein
MYMMFSRSISLLIAAQLLYSLPVVAAPPALSRTCRAELINEVSRKWNDINGVLLSETLARVSRELEAAQRRGDTEITLNTIDLAATYIASQVSFLSSQDYPKLSAILDQIVPLARSLPSGYSAVKTNVLTQTGKAYQQIGQLEKAKQTLRLAAQAAPGIQGNQNIAPAQIQLAEAWITTNQSTEATTALNIAVEQTVKAKQEAYYRRDALSRIVNLYVQAEQPGRALTTLNLLSPDDRNPLITLPQIAAAFVKTKDSSTAQRILDPLLKQALETKDIDQRESQLMSIAVYYAPSGDLAKLQQIVAQMTRPNYYRARVWFAIAGESRYFNQPQVRTLTIECRHQSGKHGRSIRGTLRSRVVWRI